MKSCFILYDIAITILEQMKPSKEQVILFFAGLFFVLPGSFPGDVIMCRSNFQTCSGEEETWNLKN